MLDGAEVIAGTNPLVAGDQLDITATMTPATDGLILTWQSQTGQLYSVLATRNLVLLPWTNIAGYVDVPGTGGLMSWTNSVLSGMQDFYKIGVQQRP